MSLRNPLTNSNQPWQSRPTEARPVRYGWHLCSTAPVAVASPAEQYTECKKELKASTLPPNDLDPVSTGATVGCARTNSIHGSIAVDQTWLRPFEAWTQDLLAPGS